MADTREMKIKQARLQEENMQLLQEVAKLKKNVTDLEEEKENVHDERNLAKLRVEQLESTLKSNNIEVPEPLKSDDNKLANS